jgi:hypothetical protein
MKFKELQFANVAEIKEAVTDELKQAQKEEFSAAFQKLYDRAKACVCANGAYFGFKKLGVFDFVKKNSPKTFGLHCLYSVDGKWTRERESVCVCLCVCVWNNDEMMLTRENPSTRSKTCSIVPLLAAKPIWKALGLNPGLHDERLASNREIRGTAFRHCLITLKHSLHYWK